MRQEPPESRQRTPPTPMRVRLLQEEGAGSCEHPQGHADGDAGNSGEVFKGLAGHGVLCRKCPGAPAAAKQGLRGLVPQGWSACTRWVQWAQGVHWYQLCHCCVTGPQIAPSLDPPTRTHSRTAYSGVRSKRDGSGLPGTLPVFPCFLLQYVLNKTRPFVENPMDRVQWMGTGCIVKTLLYKGLYLCRNPAEP